MREEEDRAGPLPYRQGPADAGERAVEAEEVDQVKGEDHDEVANGDHFEVSEGTVVGPRGAAHAGEGNQQRDLRHRHRPVRERHLQGANGNKTTATQTTVENGGTATVRVISSPIGWKYTMFCTTAAFKTHVG